MFLVPFRVLKESVLGKYSCDHDINYCIFFRPDLLGLLTLILPFRMPLSSNGTALHMGKAEGTVQESVQLLLVLMILWIDWVCRL